MFWKLEVALGGLSVGMMGTNPGSCDSDVGFYAICSIETMVFYVQSWHCGVHSKSKSDVTLSLDEDVQRDKHI